MTGSRLGSPAGAMDEACHVPVPAGCSSRRRLRLSLLGTSGCATLVIGRPSPLEPAPRPPGGELVVVGADGGAVDEQARSALADLETFWAEQFPEVYGQEFQPLQGGYFSVDPDASDPREYPQGVGCGLEPGRGGQQRLLLPGPRVGQLRRDHLRPGVPRRAGGRLRPVPARVGDGPRVRPRRPGARRACPAPRSPPRRRPTAWPAPGRRGWPAGEAEHSQLREPELDEVLSGYFLLRDPVGTSTAEESAHGSYFDRVSGIPGRVRRRPGGLPRRVRPGAAVHPGRVPDDDDVRPAATPPTRT